MSLFKKKRAKAEDVPIEPVQEINPSNGVPPEIVAVIAAAVTAYYGAGKAQIRRIRQQPSRPVWSFAGVMENTRPF